MEISRPCPEAEGDPSTRNSSAIYGLGSGTSPRGPQMVNDQARRRFLSDTSCQHSFR